jgi:hypothetical protein
MPDLRKLSDLEKETLLEFIIDLDSRGYLPRLRGIEEMATQLRNNRDASLVDKRWAINFIKEQPDLKTRFQRRTYNRFKYKRTLHISHLIPPTRLVTLS